MSLTQKGLIGLADTRIRNGNFESFFGSLRHIACPSQSHSKSSLSVSFSHQTALLRFALTQLINKHNHLCTKANHNMDYSALQKIVFCPVVWAFRMSYND